MRSEMTEHIKQKKGSHNNQNEVRQLDDLSTSLLINAERRTANLSADMI